MNRVKILHCADLHLGKVHAGQHTCGDALDALRRICSLCREENIDFLLIAGDLFERNDTPGTLFGEVSNLLGMIAPTQVLIVAGNHDYLSPNGCYSTGRLPDNVFVFGEQLTCQVFEQQKVRVWGQSFASPHVTVSPEAITPPEKESDWIALGILHGEVCASGRSMYRPIAREWISKSGLHYLALGHQHGRTALLKEGQTIYAYSGCPQGQGFDEGGTCGVYMGTIDNAGTHLSFVPTSAYKWHVLSLSVPSGLPARERTSYQGRLDRLLLEKFGENYKKNQYKILLQGEQSTGEDGWAAEQWAEVIRTVAPHAVVVDEREIPRDFAALSGEPGLRGVFVKKLWDQVVLLDRELETLSETDGDAADRERREELTRKRRTLCRALELGLAAFDGGEA